jgi:hypothetical protein
MIVLDALAALDWLCQTSAGKAPRSEFIPVADIGKFSPL